jgi:hypothetical protein
VREAHPIDGSAPSTHGLIEDPITDAERTQVASTCVEDLDLPMPALIDRIDDKVGLAYAAWPDRLYLVGKEGKIVYAGERGPRGFDPAGWAKAIEAEKARSGAQQEKGTRPQKGRQPPKKVEPPDDERDEPPAEKPPASGE